MADGTPDVDAQGSITDGFHLLIDALKLNEIETIYGVRRVSDRFGTRVLEWFDGAGPCDDELLANDTDFWLFGAGGRGSDAGRL